MIGRSVGKYRVLDRIGRGGMGTVYRAVDDTLQREVAIKVLNSEITEPEALKRFRAEAMTLAKLQHPAIATLFELCEDDGNLLMVMEFVHGETLQRLAERMGRVPPDFAAQLCAQALDGLAHAHRAGIIHRDLKPGNIMVTDDGVVKVMDFGIARITGSEHLTSDGLSMGTPSYMAPEQVLGREVDPRSDVYAMGVVLYRLWTGQLPFDGETPFAIANKQLNEAPTPLNVTCPDLPAWCDAILARALAKRRTDRFQTAQEFKAALVASARFIPLDDQATMTTATPRGVLTAPVPQTNAERGHGSSGWQRAAVTGRPLTAAHPEQTSRTLVITTRHMFAGVGALILALVIIVAGGVIAMRRIQPGTSGAPGGLAGAPAPAPASQPPAPSAAAPPSVSAALPASPKLPSGAATKPLGTGAATAAKPVVDQPKQSSSDIAAPSTAASPSNAPASPAGSRVAGAPPSAVGAAAATLPPLTFDKLKMVVVEGEKAREQDAELQFAGGRVTIYGPERRVVAAVPYDAVRTVTSSRSRQPRWRQPDGSAAEAKLGGGPLGFMKSDRNWLAFVTSKGVYIFRVDDGRLRSVIQAIGVRAGVPVVRLQK